MFWKCAVLQKFIREEAESSRRYTRQKRTDLLSPNFCNAIHTNLVNSHFSSATYIIKVNFHSIFSFFDLRNFSFSSHRQRRWWTNALSSWKSTTASKKYQMREESYPRTIPVAFWCLRLSYIIIAITEADPIIIRIRWTSMEAALAAIKSSTMRTTVPGSSSCPQILFVNQENYAMALPKHDRQGKRTCARSLTFWWPSNSFCSLLLMRPSIRDRWIAKATTKKLYL